MNGEAGLVTDQGDQLFGSLRWEDELRIDGRGRESSQLRQRTVMNGVANGELGLLGPILAGGLQTLDRKSVV